MTHCFARGELGGIDVRGIVLQGSGARMLRPNYSPVYAILTG